MPDRDFDPKEGEYILVMNQFVDKLISYKLDSNEWSILMLVIRKTWGIQGRPWADLPWKDIREATQLAESSLTYAMRKLKARNIIHVLENNKKVTRYKINSKVGSWKKNGELKPIRKKISPLSSEVKISPRSSEVFSLAGARCLPHSSEVLPLKTNIKDIIKDTPLSPPTPKPTKKEIIREQAKSVVDLINEISGKGFKHSASSLEPIIARLNEGFTLEECYRVCQTKWDDPHLDVGFYRPVTLFRARYFESYLNAKGTKPKRGKMTKAQEIKARKMAKWQRRYDEKHR